MVEITKGELRELIEKEKIRADQLFSKEDFIKDEKLIKAMAEKQELEDYRNASRKPKEDKLSDDDLIPGGPPTPLGDEEKKRQKEENEFIPDGKADSEDNDFIPD